MPGGIVKTYIGPYEAPFIIRKMHLQPGLIKVAEGNHDELRFQASEDKPHAWLLLLYIVHNDKLPESLDFANKNLPDPINKSAPDIKPEEVDIADWEEAFDTQAIKREEGDVFNWEGGFAEEGGDGLKVQNLLTDTWQMCQRYKSMSIQIAVLQAYAAWLDKDCEDIDRKKEKPRASCANGIAKQIFENTKPGAPLRDVMARGLIKAAKGDEKSEKIIETLLAHTTGGRECVKKAIA